MGIVTVFAPPLSRTVTDVDTEAMLIPRIWRTPTTLSDVVKAAVAIPPGPPEMLYGGVPPLMSTFWDPPAVKDTDGGTALSCGGGGVVLTCVGELLLLLQLSITINRPHPRSIVKIIRRFI